MTMSEQQGGELTLYTAAGSLARARENPGVGVASAVHLNTLMSERFDVRGFLISLNERVFGGKGEVNPLRHFYDIDPQVDEASGQSRFARLFSLKSNVSWVTSAAGLSVDGKYLDLQRDIKFFSGISVAVLQSVNFDREVYLFTAQGSMRFGKGVDRIDGCWDGKPVFPTTVSHSRFFEFPFQSIPTAEQISTALQTNVDMVLSVMALHDLIPNHANTPEAEQQT